MDERRGQRHEPERGPRAARAPGERSRHRHRHAHRRSRRSAACRSHRGVPVAGCRADEARCAGADRELGRAAAAGSRRSRRARRAHEDLGARRRRATHERDSAVQGRAERSAAGTRLPRRCPRRGSRGEECRPRSARRAVPPRRWLGALQGGRRPGQADRSPGRGGRSALQGGRLPGSTRARKSSSSRAARLPTTCASSRGSSGHSGSGAHQ